MGERESHPEGLKTAIKRTIDLGKRTVIHVDVDWSKFEIQELAHRSGPLDVGKFLLNPTSL